jgi:hypothetical protein
MEVDIFTGSVQQAFHLASISVPKTEGIRGGSTNKLPTWGEIR